MYIIAPNLQKSQENIEKGVFYPFFNDSPLSSLTWAQVFVQLLLQCF